MLQASQLNLYLGDVVCAKSAQVLPQYIALAKLGGRENSVAQ
jgi:hypothetical protein